MYVCPCMHVCVCSCVYRISFLQASKDACVCENVHIVFGEKLNPKFNNVSVHRYELVCMFVSRGIFLSKSHHKNAYCHKDGCDCVLCVCAYVHVCVQTNINTFAVF